MHCPRMGVLVCSTTFAGSILTRIDFEGQSCIAHDGVGVNLLPAQVLEISTTRPIASLPDGQHPLRRSKTALSRKCRARRNASIPVRARPPHTPICPPLRGQSGSEVVADSVADRGGESIFGGVEDASDAVGEVRKRERVDANEEGANEVRHASMLPSIRSGGQGGMSVIHLTSAMP